jgi:hypothetical protein
VKETFEDPTVESVLVTSTDGKLFGLIKRQEIERRMGDGATDLGE